MSTVNGDPNSLPHSYGNFDLLRRVQLEIQDVAVSKWRSRATGLNVIHVDYQAPIVKGYFVVPTEIFNDTGCPHTLEHLVFLGSKQYPFKGVLDKFATRAFSDGTNAWTDTDHTAYTLTTAGPSGFLRLLPIYVDHILYPTLTQEGFVTEVFHVDGEGRESGVVFSEVQGTENTPSDLSQLKMSRIINPEGSAYRSETGGLMEALRSLTIEQIREYHASYYIPRNTCLFIFGKMSTTLLLQVLQKDVEPSIVRHQQTSAPRAKIWQRPFVDTVSAHRKPLETIIREKVEFPEQDESTGEVLLTFKGAGSSDYLTSKAIDILAVYLTSSPIAPLNKALVEIPNPLCTDIGLYESSRASYCDLTLYASSVPTPELDTFDIKLREVLSRVLDEGLDMKRLSTVLQRERRKFRSMVEAAGGDYFNENLIGDFIYGKDDGGTLRDAVDDARYFAILESWDAAQWTSVLRKFLVTPPYAVVYAQPSAELAEHLENTEKQAFEKRAQRLGPEGLKRNADLLQAAQEFNDRPIPDNYIKSFPLPPVDSIQWISVQTAGSIAMSPAHQHENEALTAKLDSDSTKLPFFVQFAHVKSDFVAVNAFISTSNVPDRLRPYILTFLGSFFSLPVVRSTDGTSLTHEDVVNALDEDTVSYSASLSVRGTFDEIVWVSIKVETAQYASAVQWLRDLMFGSVFEEERLRVTVAKILQSLPESKREGDVVADSLSSTMLRGLSSTERASSVIEQSEFVPLLAQKLAEDPSSVIEDLKVLRQTLMDPSGLRFSVSGNILDLREPKAPWASAFDLLCEDHCELSPITLSADTLSDTGLSPQRQAVLVTLPAIESTYAVHSARAVQGYQHPEYPTLRVALEILNATEGFLWKFIRGAGLAYGASLSLDIESGILSFVTYRSPNSFKAFEAASKVVEELVNGKIALDEEAVESAKSSLVHSTAEQRGSPSKAALMSLQCQVLMGVGPDFDMELLQKYEKVTASEVLASLRQHVLPLFDPASSVVAVVAGPGRMGEIEDGLATYGFEVSHRDLSSAFEAPSGSETGSESGESDGSAMSIT